jgi:hypothetical protein
VHVVVVKDNKHPLNNLCINHWAAARTDEKTLGKLKNSRETLEAAMKQRRQGIHWARKIQ